MAHVYHAVEWQSGSGNWHVADTSDLSHGSSVWWVPPLVFGVSNGEYIEMLVKKYHVTNLSFNKILLFSWDKDHYSDAHRYLLDINKIARQRNVKI